ncbi:hypothetical protein [Ensifer canadensis]
MIERVECPEGLFQQLDAVVTEIIDQFASQGHGTAVVIETLQDVLEKRQDAYERDPDPTEDNLDEPANDWPGADNRGASKRK